MQIGNSELDQVYVNAIAPAIKACGFEPRRVDKHNQGGLLKSEIIQFIQNSDIIVGDITNERPNCYLEIGYAMGIDKFRNLILTVRGDHFPDHPGFLKGGPKVHFDLGGYDILSWERNHLDLFREELEKRIRRRMAILAPEEKLKALLWDEGWMKTNRQNALEGLSKSLLPGAMEISFSLQLPKPMWKQSELDEAARRSTIDTFGWPIGVYLDNRDEFRPRPRTDGILAEIAIEDKSSYDYWTIRRNGDFYSLSSLFEDRRRAGQIFFDTRVIRAAEALLYCARLYSRLGVDPLSQVQFRLGFVGLKNRALTAANPHRSHSIHERWSIEDQVSEEISTSLQGIEVNLVQLVKELLSPLFTLFDYFAPADEIYEDLVNGFVRGEVK
jgi:hypothetical protein